jgi:membrane protease YdiL (CAAX protease family)
MRSILTGVNYGLMSLGSFIAVAAVIVWVNRGRRDPLRGSPIRSNQLNLITIWLCALALTLAWMITPPIAGLVVPEALDHEVITTWKTALASPLAQVLTSIACLIVAHFTFRHGLRGFGFGRLAFRVELAWAVTGWLVAIGLCNGINEVVTRLLLWFELDLPAHGVLETISDPKLPAPLHVIAMVGAFVFAPVGEEIFFRGIIQTGMHRLWPPRWGSMRHRWIAIYLSALLFGAMHFSVYHHIPALIILGIILGYTYERTGSLLVPILLHMLFNGKTLLWFQLGAWSQEAV